ncbi:mevalonate kinase family protein [Amphritea sp.]|uniref:mevalonate kinase family protein n=1 Tax=Amphritea sp. TaxID=1872502 RepID=UPI003D1379BC
MKACAPGKLILSGEHSAVYGAPAIALAVNRYIHCHGLPAAVNGLRLSLPEAGWQTQISWPELRQLTARLNQRFTQFEQGQLSAGEILEAPHQLALYALSQCLQETDPDSGLTLEIRSQLPLGSGMGSSAALGAAVTVLGQTLFAQPLNTAELFQRVRFCERLCHGRGGLIDAATVSYGGMVQVQDGQIAQLPVQLGSGWFYIHTGAPAVGTGDCVDYVRSRFAATDIWQSFTKVTQQLSSVIATGADPRELISENHRLLTRIGVVPDVVQRFIAALEQLGGAAKVSGAGSVSGDSAGALIAYAPAIDLHALCQQYGYSFMRIEEDSKGARLED